MKICGTVRRPVSSIIAARCGRVEVDADLVDLLDAALLQQRLGAHAVRADLGRVHLDRIHAACLVVGDRRDCPRRGEAVPVGAQAAFSTGRLASRQAAVPPASGTRLLVAGLAQQRRRACRRARRSGTPAPAAAPCCVGRSLALSSWPSGTLRAPAAWPAAYSAGSLTSISTRLLAVDQAHRLGWCRPLPTPPPPLRSAATAACRRRPAASEEQQPVVDEELHEVPRGCRSVRKPRIIEFSASPCTSSSCIRHGESTWNLENRFTGWTDVAADRHRRRSRRGRPGRLLQASRLRLRRRLHLGAQARDLDAVALRWTRWTAPGCRCATTGA